MLKEYLEKFDKSLEEPKKESSKSQLKEYIEKFDESLGEPIEESPMPHSYTPTNEKISTFAPIEQLQHEIQDKDTIIEDLKNESIKLKKQVSIAEKNESIISEELRKSKWLENRVTLATKKVYEDKIQSVINENIDSKLIPVLTNAARIKQGNQQLNWGNWLKIPENKYLFQVNKDIAKGIFEDTNALIGRKNEEVRGGAIVETDKNYILSFTGDTQATARADLVRTEFTPNDPTNKGFSSSERKPLAESGFTISYWYRPDETANDAFAMGWKRDAAARFSFGMRNAARPYFGIGSNTFGTYGSHNAWYNMFNNSGNTDLTDKYIDDSDNLIADGSNWYHIVITYVGSEPGGISNNETDRYRRIYFNGKQIYGYNSEAIGTAYEDYHNVDRTGAISWPEGHLDARMSRGFSFGMRALKGSGNYVASDGETIKISKYNNGHACGLDDVAIYNELKDNDWVRSVYNGGTDYNHTGADGLVAYWRFNEGSGTRVEDLGPYGWHGTLTNSAVGDDISIQATIGEIADGVPTWEERL